MLDEVEINGGNAAFLSTPSIYFTLSDDIRKTCSLWDVSVSFASQVHFNPDKRKWKNVQCGLY